MIIPANLIELREMIVAHDVALVVYDPLVAYLPDGLDTNRDANVRHALSPLRRLAEETGCTILGLRHPRKSPSDNPLYRGGGSIAFTAAARAAYLMAPDPDEPEGNRRIFAPTKMNLGPMPAAFAFRLVTADAGGFPHLEWDGPTHHTAASLSALPILGLRGSARPRERVPRRAARRRTRYPRPRSYDARPSRGSAKRTLDASQGGTRRPGSKVGSPAIRAGGSWYLPKDANVGPKDANSSSWHPSGELGTLRAR